MDGILNMNIKYINFEKHGIVIFEPSNSHREIANLFNDKPLSAGFVNERMECYGESETLKIKSLAHDTYTLKRRFNR